MSRIVPFDGPQDANIMLIGEAPGSDEERRGIPFVGGAGSILNQLLEDAGITRKECRVGNVCRYRPPGNRFSWFYEPEQIELYRKEVDNLFAEIKRTKPNIVIALGNQPLKALMGYDGVTGWRGSLLWNDNLCTKVLPTFHPAFIMRNYDASPLLLFDLKKAREESRTIKYETAHPTLITRPSFEQIVHELNRMKKAQRVVAFDVETTYATQEEEMMMTSLAIADDPNWAIAIPLASDMEGWFWTYTEWWAIIKMLGLFFESGIPVIAQNAQFDIGVLHYLYGIKVPNLCLDTMCAFHTIYPELPKSLNMLRTTYTNIPFYDFWAAQGDEQFYRYNAMDAITCFRCSDPIIKEMKEFNVFDFYRKFVHPLIPVLLDMQMRGVKINTELMTKAFLKEMGEYEVHLNEIQNLTGVEQVINPNSTKDLKWLLYEHLNLPTKTHAKTGSPTTNQKALESLHKRHPSPIFDHIIEARHTRKMASTYLNKENVKNGRMHTSYNIGGRIKDEKGRVESGPETGRLSSSASIIIRSGSNLQNIPHGDYRRIFLPDEGKVLVSVDLSQAEARVVAYEAEEERMIKVFDEEGDIHQLSADALPKYFTPKGTEYRGIENKRRLFAKKHVHAFNYGEGERNFAAMAGISVAEGKAIRDTYFNSFPLIRQRQIDIEESLRRTRTIINPFGRKRRFFGRWNHDLLKKAYAQNPQSTVADTLNLALIRFAGIIAKVKTDIQLLLQVHDSFVLQCPENAVGLVLDYLHNSFNIPITIKGRTFTIPYEVEIGPNWEDLKVQK